jgi:hypothetical protein
LSQVFNMKHGSLRRLAQIAVLAASSLCASCYLPMTERYYVPSAEGAALADTNCAGYPPFAARFSYGKTERRSYLDVYLDRSTLVLIVSARPEETIALDPTLIRIEADGQLVSTQSIRYTMSKSGGAAANVANGLVEVTTGFLIVSMPLQINSPQNMIVHLPSMSLDGTAYKLPDVSFQFKKRTHMVPVILNC